MRSISILLVLVVLAACSGAPDDPVTGTADGERATAESAAAGEAGKGGRVLLVGLDGAAPALVDQLIEAGRLPHLAAIATEGARGAIRSRQPLASPRIWNTIVTGKTPDHHGILAFAHPAPDGKPVLYLSTDRKTHALWNIASRAGRTVGVVNFWNTYPPAHVDGVIVSDHVLAHNVRGRRLITGARPVPTAPLTFPPAWGERVDALVAESDPLTDIANPLDPDAGLPPWLTLAGDDMSAAFTEDGDLARIAIAIDEAIEPDVLMVLLPGVDRASHMLWGSLVADQTIYPAPLRMDAGMQRAGRRALETYYHYADALVGLLAERFGEGDLVLVMSDHGFEPGVGLGILTGEHESEAAIDGIAFARGPGIEAGARIRDLAVEDVTPTILAWMGLPVGEDMDGHVASFVHVDPPETIPTWDTEPIPRLSLEPSGAEDEIIHRLKTLGYIE